MAHRNVLQVIDHLEVGGAQRLLEVLVKSAFQGETVKILSLGSENDFFYRRLLDQGAEITLVENCRIWNPLSFLRVIRMVRSAGVDALHLHLTYATIFGAIAGFVARVPSIVSVHNVQTVQYGGLRGRVLKWLETSVIRHFVERVIFVGRIAAIANAPNYPKKPVATIDNVVEPADPGLSAQRDALRSSLCVPADNIVVLSTARLDPVKDISTLLGAFAQIADQFPNVSLWICGDGPMRDRLQAESEPIKERVQFLGRRDDVPILLAAADIFVLSSISEGLPLALLEALAAGLPVVATTVGSVPEYVDSRFGILVPPNSPTAFADALETLVSNPDLRADMASAACASAFAFTDIQGWRRKLEAEYALLAN